MSERRPPGSRPHRLPESPPTDPRLAAVATGDLAAVRGDRDPLTSTDPLRLGPPTHPDAPVPRRTTLHPGVLLDGRYQLQRHISDRADVQLWQGEDQVLARPVAIRLLIDNGSPTANDGSRALLEAPVAPAS